MIQRWGAVPFFRQTGAPGQALDAPDPPVQATAAAS